MGGIKALRKITLGGEQTAGTAVPTTYVWRGLGTMEDTREPAFAEEDIGIMQDTGRIYTPKVAAAITFDEVPATFEQLPYILEAGIKTVWTAATADAGSGKIYTYGMGTTAANTIKTFTIEAGDNNQAQEMEYSFVTAFSLKGNAGEAWMLSADWVGRQVSLCTATTSLTAATIEEALFSKTTLYIDTAGSIGTTTKANTLLSAELNVGDTGNVPVFTADGQLYFAYQKQQRPGDPATLTMTFEHDATALAELVCWKAGTPRAIRLLTTGTALTTTGTTHTTKKLIIDVWGVWEDFEKLGEQDGNDVVTGTFRIGYNATGAKALEITVVNQLTTLT